MKDGRTEQVGNVTLDYTYYPDEDFYCDGVSEDELLEIVKTVPEEKYPAVIREKCSWEILYHLSDLRENIVEWLPIDQEMKVLEVGSGCGAITGSLARRASSVTCVDLSRKRSLINAHRHKELSNITIHVGNFTDIEPSLPADYDYVCLIGVFEYGQSYIGGETPFTDFYNIIKKHVKQGGRIVIAIENKMGLKYWAGCKEDHLGAYFSGLEDYPEGGAARTFTKAGLERILKDCKEENYRFYYPYPDYKFMTMVYSDRYLPKVGELSNNLRNFDRDRMLLFDEKKVFDMLIREGLFPLYSNSFLVVAGPEPETVYSRFSNDRSRKLCIRTDILKGADGKNCVRKYPANPDAEGHIKKLAENYRVFSARFEGSGLSVNRLSEKRVDGKTAYVELEFLENAVTLEELLDECLQREDGAVFEQLFNRYLGLLRWKADGQLADFDLIFPNICVQGDDWTMIDYEWTTHEMTPEEIAQRALYCYIQENEKRRDDPIVKRAMEKAGMDEAAFEICRERELFFQGCVMREADGTARSAVTDMRHLIGNRAVPWQEFFARAERKRVQVFEDFGDGYSPENAYYMYDAYEADDLIKAVIPLKAGTRAVRLDPAEQPCIVRIRKVTWAGRAFTQEELDRAVTTNGEPFCGREPEGERCITVLFDSGDPNINVRLDALDTDARRRGETALTWENAPDSTCLTLEAEIAWISTEMLEDIKTRITRRKRAWFQR